MSMIIRDAKPMVVPATAMTMVVLILGLSRISMEVTAAEPIPDSELATLYGGWFYNPYCTKGGSTCPEDTCATYPLSKCRFCIRHSSMMCVDDWSWIWDPDDCETGQSPCAKYPNYGYCITLICHQEDYETGQIYPECSESHYHWCND